MFNMFKNPKIKKPIVDTEIIKSTINKINLNSIRIENFRDVLFYICDDVQRSLVLSGYLKKELTRIFGKHNTRYKGEFYYYIWILEFEGYVFEVYTAPVKGSSISILNTENKDLAITCIRFLSKLEDLLKDVSEDI